MTVRDMVRHAATERFNALPAKFRECNLGGCSNHSGHEICSREDTMDECQEWAEAKFQKLSDQVQPGSEIFGKAMQ